MDYPRIYDRTNVQETGSRLLVAGISAWMRQDTTIKLWEETVCRTREGRDVVQGVSLKKDRNEVVLNGHVGGAGDVSGPMTSSWGRHNLDKAAGYIGQREKKRIWHLDS